MSLATEPMVAGGGTPERAAGATAATRAAWLVPVGGPVIGTLELAGGKPGGLLIGRHEGCDLRLAADNVSRTHARLTFDGQRWRVADLKSRWGTYVNGVRISVDQDVPLADGDLLRISPWTFRFVAGASARGGLLDHALEAVDDAAEAGRHVQTLTVDRLPTLGDEMLTLLLDSASTIHAAADERALAATVLEKACLGSGLPNAAVLKPAGGGGRYEVIASRSPDGANAGSAAGGAAIAYSRSLLAAAAGGEVAELSTERQPVDVSQSIVSMGVRSALCVPILLGQTVAAYLYLDSRGDPNSALRLPLRPNAAPFCLALGRMAGLALANLKRIDMERRSANIEADLAAAAAAQQWILPKREGAAGRFTWTGESRPGSHVGGDFYDVIALDGERLAIAVGDVSGHGVAASVLMTAAAGFLHATLQETGDPALAVNRLNRFVCPRKPVERFLTLWVGVFDPRAGTLHYVDAGHGYALLGVDTPALRPVNDEGGQYPIGVDEDCAYIATVTPLSPRGCALLISDGIVEQFGPGPDAATGRPAPFSLAGVERVMSGAAADCDVVKALFDAVVQHAGQPASLSDDATAMLVRW